MPGQNRRGIAKLLKKAWIITAIVWVMSMATSILVATAFAAGVASKIESSAAAQAAEQNRSFTPGAAGDAGAVTARLPNWTGPISSGSHSGAPYNWGSVVTEQVVNRIGGGIVGAVNTELRQGTAITNDLVNGAVQGFANGATGPLSGRRASGW